MQVKIFETTDMASGLKLVKKELGPDALILSTRTVRSGKLGLLGRQVLEITAAIDTPWPKKSEQDASLQSQPPLEHQAYTRNSGASPSVQPEEGHVRQTFLPPFKIGARSESLPHISDQTCPPTEENPRIRQEFDELKSMVKNLAGDIARLSQRSASDSAHVRNSALSGNTVLHRRIQSSGYTRVLDLLLSHGVNMETAQTISGFTKDSLNEEDLSDHHKLHGFLQSTISDILKAHRSSLNVAAGNTKLPLSDQRVSAKPQHLRRLQQAT